MSTREDTQRVADGLTGAVAALETLADLIQEGANKRGVDFDELSLSVNHVLRLIATAADATREITA